MKSESNVVWTYSAFTGTTPVVALSGAMGRARVSVMMAVERRQGKTWMKSNL